MVEELMELVEALDTVAVSNSTKQLAIIAIKGMCHEHLAMMVATNKMTWQEMDKVVAIFGILDIGI